MLVLSRTIGQKIYVRHGDVIIEIMVTDVDRNKVRVGIKAPRYFQIYREELAGHVPPPHTRKTPDGDTLPPKPKTAADWSDDERGWADDDEE